jgi:hypothetical protein
MPIRVSRRDIRNQIWVVNNLDDGANIWGWVACFVDLNHQVKFLRMLFRAAKRDSLATALACSADRICRSCL